MAAIFQKTFSNALSWTKIIWIIWISIKISLKFGSKGSINNIPTIVQIMAGRQLGDKLLSEPMMIDLLTHICVNCPQWVNWKSLGRHINSGDHAQIRKKRTHIPGCQLDFTEHKMWFDSVALEQIGHAAAWRSAECRYGKIFHGAVCIHLAIGRKRNHNGHRFTFHRLWVP